MFLTVKVSFLSAEKNSAVQIIIFSQAVEKALTIFFTFIIIYVANVYVSFKNLRRYTMATKKKVNPDEAVSTVENVTEVAVETGVEQEIPAVETPVETTADTVETGADAVETGDEKLVENDKSKQPLSLEDALAAAEFAAGQYETFAAEEKAGEAQKQPSEPVPEEEEMPEIGVATFDPSMLDEGEMVQPLPAEIPVETVEEITADTAEPEPEIGAVAFDPSMLDEGETTQDTPAEEPAETPVETPVATAEEPVADTAEEVPAPAVETEDADVATLPEVSEERPVEDGQTTQDEAEKAPEEVAEKPAKPAKKSGGKSRAKKASEKVEDTPLAEEVTLAPVEENAPADTATEPVEAEKPAEEPAKSDVKKGKGLGKKAKEKAEVADTAETEEPVAEKSDGKKEKQELTPRQLSDKLRAKLTPEKNFRLLKILIIVLSVICAGLTAYVYLFHIYDWKTPFSLAKIVPLIPFIAQLLLLLITLLTAGTSKRRPIGTAFKETIQIKQEEKEKEKDEKIAKEISDHLLEPEVALNTTKRTVELPSFQIDNFYKKNIEEINGKYYMQVAKFDDSVKMYNALGATDMELCAVNMVGSAKFDEILNQPRTKTLSAQELATYFMSKPNVFTIKKRGALDWTFKYNSKSFGIIRENEDSYKVSIKCYPDAAQRINDVYKALEDSNFPSGPLWYCFNELRNLPPRVCKWLVDTSCQISQFQQIKTDKLKDVIKTAKDYDIDIADIRTKFQAGETVLKFPKFTMIFSKGTDADMTTYLTRECEGVDASAYTKEYYYKFADGENSVSILCPTKGLSEDVIIAIFDEIEKVAK